jgi:hypothetical protein
VFRVTLAFAFSACLVHCSSCEMVGAADNW